FRPDIPLYRITPAPMKASLLAGLGFDAVVEQQFNAEFAGRSAEAFVRSVLCERLGISHVVAGFDFHFGKDRQGDPAYLVSAGKRHGFAVTQVSPCRDRAEGEIISSSRIRAKLAA